MLLPIFQTCCGITRSLRCQQDINQHYMKVNFRSFNSLLCELLIVACTNSCRYEMIRFGVAWISLTPPPSHPTAIEGAWTSPFRGRGAELFRFGLDRMNNDRGDRLYANFVPIIQSSGMGKSRLVDETAKLIFTIPFCFRSESDGGCIPRRHLQYIELSLQDTQRRI
jgi:hypothetical protein